MFWFVTGRSGAAVGTLEGFDDAEGGLDGEVLGTGEVVGGVLGSTEGPEDIVGRKDGEPLGLDDAVGCRVGSAVGRGDGNEVGPTEIDGSLVARTSVRRSVTSRRRRTFSECDSSSWVRR